MGLTHPAAQKNAPFSSRGVQPSAFGNFNVMCACVWTVASVSS
jgi:hypothetical protein